MIKDRLYQIYTSEVDSVDFWYLRPEIKDILINSDKIKRFTGTDIPDGVITDSVFTHTKRCLSLANEIPINFYNKSILKLTLILHDLPEVTNLLKEGKLSDTTSPEKESNLSLDNEIASKEMQIAKTIFNPQELFLYECFEESGNFLKNKSYNIKYLTGVAVLAQLIDKIDANLTLHINLSKWANTEDPYLNTIKIEKSLTYAFRQYDKFMPRLNILENDNLKFFAISLLRSQIDIINRLWK